MKKTFWYGAALLTASCTQVPLPPGISGVTHIDEGTDYVYFDQPTNVDGACKGWKRLVVSKRNDYYGGLDNLLCWKLDGPNVHVTSASGDNEQVTPSAAIWDLKSNP